MARDGIGITPHALQRLVKRQAATAHASELVTQRYFQRVAFVEWTPERTP